MLDGTKQNVLILYCGAAAVIRASAERLLSFTFSLFLGLFRVQCLLLELLVWCVSSVKTLSRHFRTSTLAPSHTHNLLHSSRLCLPSQDWLNHFLHSLFAKHREFGFCAFGCNVFKDYPVIFQCLYDRSLHVRLYRSCVSLNVYSLSIWCLLLSPHKYLSATEIYLTHKNVLGLVLFFLIIHLTYL